MDFFLKLKLRKLNLKIIWKKLEFWKLNLRIGILKIKFGILEFFGKLISKSSLIKLFRELNFEELNYELEFWILFEDGILKINK